MELNPDILKQLIKSARTSIEYEIGCDDCFDRLHKFADMKLKGKSSTEAMPLVQDHLDRCGECSREYRALLEALKYTYS